MTGRAMAGVALQQQPLGHPRGRDGPREDDPGYCLFTPRVFLLLTPRVFLLLTSRVFQLKVFLRHGSFYHFSQKFAKVASRASSRTKWASGRRSRLLSFYALCLSVIDAPRLSTSARLPIKCLFTLRVCLLFPLEIYDNNLSGILADEMGLGKTIQVTVVFRPTSSYY